MAKAVTAVVVTEDDSLLSRITSLTNGGRIAILGSTLLTERGLRKIAKKPPSLTLVDAASGESHYLPFVRSLTPLCPKMSVVLLSSTSDVSVLARAAISGFTAVVPPLLPQDQLTTALAECVNGGTPTAGAAFARVREQLGVVDRAAPTTSVGSLDKRVGERIATCVRLGLTDTEIASFLKVPVSSVPEHAPDISANSHSTKSGSNPHALAEALTAGVDMLRPQPGDGRRLGIACGIIVAGYLSWMLAQWWFSPPSPLGIAGQVTFQGTPIELGEIEFVPLAGSPAQRHTTAISNGSFTLPNERGLLTNRVYGISLRGFRPTGRHYDAAPGVQPTPEYEQYIPSAYNSETTLRIDTSRRESRSPLMIDIP